MSANFQKVLVAPLNWGLGHATRCIPLINEFINKGVEVHIASDGQALELLKVEFPQLKFYELPGYDVKYGEESAFGALLFQLPGLMKNISKEYVQLQSIQEEEKYDLIISDNRPGVKTKSAKCVYLTHQLQFKIKIGGRMAYRLHKMLYKDFDEVWVPDVEPPHNLAGDIAEKGKFPVKYIGQLSRATNALEAKIYDVLVILSGPEPQRSKLEDEVYRQLKNTKYKVALVRGTSIPRLRTNPKFHVVDLADAKTMDILVAQSKVVIARTGYSTLMDLSIWRKPCVLIPTPGQPEQEYLGVHLKSEGWAHVVSQNKLNLKEDLEQAVKFGYAYQPRIESII